MKQQFLSEFVDGGPGCSRDDCEVQVLNGSTTLAYEPPTFDSKGNLIHRPSVNTTVYNKRCTSCGKTWSEGWQHGTRVS